MVAIKIIIMIVTGIILASIVIIGLVRRLAIDSGLNQQIIIASGERVGNTLSSSVELYDAELYYRNTLIAGAPESVMKRIVFQDVITQEVEAVNFYSQVIIGRIEKGNDGIFIVNREGVSRSHSRIFVNKGQYYIEDLNSLNHTYLNGEQVTCAREIGSGSRISFGGSNYIISY